jgi:hypothetical protein
MACARVAGIFDVEGDTVHAIDRCVIGRILMRGTLHIVRNEEKLYKKPGHTM